MLIFFAFDNDDMESSKRRVTFLIVDFSFKKERWSKVNATLLLLWKQDNFLCFFTQPALMLP